MFAFDNCAEVSSISRAKFKHGTRAHRLPLQLVAGMVLHLAMVISWLTCCAVGPKMLLFKRLILCQ
jgi:hypothetical protein